MNTTVAITPVPREAGDHAAAAVHAHLRSLILQGAFPPGAQLNQVELAPLLGVSRTPLREAIRMLQEEGLVEAEPQKRARIVDFDPGHLEAVYAQRMLLEGLAATLTAAAIRDDDLREIKSLLTRMRKATAAGDHPAWHEAHKLFHTRLVTGVGPHVVRSISNHMDRAEHYRLMFLYRDSSPRSRATGDAEHAEIVEAYSRRDGSAAAAALVAHLARTALSLIAELAPAHDPAVIRAALATYHAAPGVAVAHANGSVERRAIAAPA